MIAELDVAFASHTMDDLGAKFDEHDVWWAPINTAFTLLDDAQVAASGAFVEMPEPRRRR